MGGRVCLVTGATQGIGKVTARELARQGATVLITARNAERGAAVVDEITRATGNDKVELYLADLSLLAEVRRLADEVIAKHDRLHVLINNAGAMHQTRKETAEGLEVTFATNHLAYFLLTQKLLPLLEKSGEPGRAARIVNVASTAHRRADLDLDDLQLTRGWTPFRSYGNSKLANILYTYELAERLQGKPVTANCLHPGVVATGFGKNDPGVFKALVRIGQLFMIGPEEGAKTTLYLATSPEVEGVSGKYFARSALRSSTRASYDVPTRKRLWELSEKLVSA